MLTGNIVTTIMHSIKFSNLFYFFPDYYESTEYPQLPETTVRPTPGVLLTTTMQGPLDCRYNDEVYGDGARIESSNPCEHCYCMRGDIMCALQECGTPLEREGKNCTALPPQPGQCCPEQYQCGESHVEFLFTLSD